MWDGQNMKLRLRRGLSREGQNEKRQLLSILQSLNLSEQKDSAVWLWDTKSIYTVKSCYRFLMFGGITVNKKIQFGRLKYL